MPTVEFPAESGGEQPSGVEVDLGAVENLLRVTHYLDDEISEHPGEVALVSVDLDELKEINDTYGHDEGDKYILFTLGVLNDSVRTKHLEGDTERRPLDSILVSGTAIHKSGDEYWLVLRGVSRQDQVDDFIKRLQTELEELGIRASMGGSPHMPGQSALDLVKVADANMRQNKLDRVREFGEDEVTDLLTVERILGRIGVRARNLETVFHALAQRGQIQPLE